MNTPTNKVLLVVSLFAGVAVIITVWSFDQPIAVKVGATIAIAAISAFNIWRTFRTPSGDAQE